MRNKEKITSIVTGSILFVLSAVVSISLLIGILDYGSVTPGMGSPLHIFGSMLYSVYGLSSILIPVFLFIAGIFSIDSSWSLQKLASLLVSIVPFFTVSVAENLSRKIAAQGLDPIAIIKITGIMLLAFMLATIEYLATIVLSGRFSSRTTGASKDNLSVNTASNLSAAAKSLKNASSVKVDVTDEIISEEDFVDTVELEPIINPEPVEAPVTENIEATVGESRDEPAEVAEPDIPTVDSIINASHAETMETVAADDDTTEKQSDTIKDLSDDIDEEINAAVDKTIDEVTDDSKWTLNELLKKTYKEVEEETKEDDIWSIDDQGEPKKNRIKHASGDDSEVDMNSDPWHVITPALDDTEPEQESTMNNDVFFEEPVAADIEDRVTDEDDIIAQFEKQNFEDSADFDSPLREQVVAVKSAKHSMISALDNVFDKMEKEAMADYVSGDMDNHYDEPEDEDLQDQDSVAIISDSVADDSFAELEPVMDDAFAAITTEDEPVIASDTVLESQDDSDMMEEPVLVTDEEPEMDMNSDDYDSDLDIPELDADSDENVSGEDMISGENAGEDSIPVGETFSEDDVPEQVSQPIAVTTVVDKDGNMISTPISVPEPKKRINGTYKIPTELLTVYEDNPYWIIDEETNNAAQLLKETLREFKIDVTITGIRKGPVVTMFEMLPAPGVNVTKIVSLSDNIALRLAARSVRIVPHIPGKTAMGIEIPNKQRAMVSFRECIEQNRPEWKKMAVPVVLGKDIEGEVKLMDIVRTPHLLIAGATGAGKSVCVNSLILSILYKRNPSEVKMILIDPKVVELKLYNDIPHLLTRVITEPKKALQALQYCLCEMERRYAVLDSLGCRDIASYNKKIVEQHIATEKLPYLVVIIDEFADLMATTGKQLEGIIARLAAMSRAVGIHLVLATQRPSIDVITGLIKANIPSRIAFMVSSKTDSRVILDQIGAEKLLGMGDMLYAGATDPFPTRIQGTFISDQEVEDVVDAVKQWGEPEYIDDEIFVDDEDVESSDQMSLFNPEGGEDPLYEKALEIVVQAGKASASYIQRRLKIGYNRAARLVEEMEERGIVGPANGSKPRELINIP